MGAWPLPRDPRAGARPQRAAPPPAPWPTATDAAQVVRRPAPGAGRPRRHRRRRPRRLLAAGASTAPTPPRRHRRSPTPASRRGASSTAGPACRGGGWPGTVEDVAAAVAAVRADPAPRPDRLVLVGHSAGGHLVAWAASQPGRTACAGSSLGRLRRPGPHRATSGSGDGAPPELHGRRPRGAAARGVRPADPARLRRRAGGPRCTATRRRRSRREVVPVLRAGMQRPRTGRHPRCSSMLVAGGDHFGLIDPAHPAFAAVARRRWPTLALRLAAMTTGRGSARQRLARCAPAHRHRQGRHRQDDGRGRAGAGPGRQGKRVLLVEVEGRQGIAQTFDVPPLARPRSAGSPTTAAAARSSGLAVDAKAALLEYLQMFYKLGRAGGLLERFGAVDFATTIAPGRARRPADRQGLRGGRAAGPPATGPGRRRRTTRSSSTPRRPGASSASSTSTHEVAGLAKVGPIRSQADSITAMLRSPQTVVHVVTLLEEMPVQETVDALGRAARRRLPLGGDRRQPGPRPAAAGRGARRRPRRAGSTRRRGRRRPRPRSALRAADARWSTGCSPRPRDHAERVEPWSARAGRDARGHGRPTYRLPLLPEGIDAGAHPRARRRCSPSRGWPDTAPRRRPARRARAPEAPPLDVDALLADPARGSSSAAAPAASARPRRPPRSALRAAEHGRKVVVLTIDPARRLAQSLGLTELDNTPRPVRRHRRARPAARSTR